MAEKHFYEQVDYTKKYLLPYFQKHIKEFHKKRVLEVGCAEGGLLNVLNEMGMDVYGLEISQERADIAIEKNPKVEILVGDITDPELSSKIHGKFDLIVMREVIEHVMDKHAIFSNLTKMLSSNGYLFISFPPKYSPFAGHQQIAKSFLKIIPYLHLLPRFVLDPLAKFLGEVNGYVDEIKLHYSTGMNINLFEKFCNGFNLTPVKKDLYIFRPIYAGRFGLPTLPSLNIYLIREGITMGYEVLLKKNE